MEVRWYGTASLNFSCEGQTLLFDPFLMLNSGLKVTTEEELSVLGDIFITHSHFDHLMHAAPIAIRGQRQIYCPDEGIKHLHRQGVPVERVHPVTPGQVIQKGPFTIRVLTGEHIKFDWPLVVRTFCSWRAVGQLGSLLRLLTLHRQYHSSQTLIYFLEAEGKSILHLGSLGLADNESYPVEPDVMTLPYQGRSDLDIYALHMVERIRPRSLFLHHIDDAFPPVSSTVDPTKFIVRVQKKYPGLPVYIPQYRQPYQL